MSVNNKELRIERKTSFGSQGLKPLERLGVWLSHTAIQRVISRYNQPKLLDLGSGYSCRLVKFFQSHLSHCMAVDIAFDPQLQSYKSLSLLESSIEEAWPKIPNKYFDIVTIINVLEHIWEPQQVLDEAFHRLNNGGTLIVNVPTWLGKTVHEFQAFKLKLSDPIEIDDHKRYYDKRDLWPMLVRAGFKPSQIRMSYHKLRFNLFATATRH